jgi:hypothetical protein
MYFSTHTAIQLLTREQKIQRYIASFRGVPVDACLPKSLPANAEGDGAQLDDTSNIKGLQLSVRDVPLPTRKRKYQRHPKVTIARFLIYGVCDAEILRPMRTLLTDLHLHTYYFQTVSPLDEFLPPQMRSCPRKHLALASQLTTAEALHDRMIILTLRRNA